MKPNQGALLTFMPLLVLAITLMIVSMRWYDRYGSVEQAGDFGILGAISLGIGWRPSWVCSI